MSDSRSLRILQIVKGLDIGGINGGAEKLALELSRNMHARQVDITVCSYYQYGTAAEQHWHDLLVREGIPVFFASSDDRLHLFSALRKIVAVCREKKINLAHFHNQVGGLATLYLKMTGKVHWAVRTAGTTIEWGDGVRAWILRKIFTDYVYPLVIDREVGVSEAIVALLRDHPGARLARKPKTLIYNALPDEMLERSQDYLSARGMDANKKSFVIGSVGRLTPRKGYADLLEALLQVVKEIPDVQLKLVGDGDQLSALMAQASQPGISGKVEFLGQRQNVLELLSTWDLFVLPTFNEGLPTVILESMACAVPVVSTDIPGVRELVTDGETGWLVPTGDAAALAKAIVDALRNPTRRASIRQNAAGILDRFSMRQITTQYLDLYNSLQTERKNKTNES
jgi:glycosyltransferase involved in cell wall biosynthesis